MLKLSFQFPGQIGRNWKLFWIIIKHEPQKLKAAKFLIANMRYHHSFYSLRNPRQHPLLDSLTRVADSLFYHSVYVATDSFHNGNIQKLIDSVRTGFRKQNDVRVSEQSVQNVLERRL